MHRGELRIGGLVVFTTILRVVTHPNPRDETKFRAGCENLFGVVILPEAPS